MKKIARWLVRSRIPVIILCFALVVPSVFGMQATKTKYDLLYYLPQDLETMRGQEILMEDFGKGAFALLVTEGMTMEEQADMENAVREIPHVDSVIGCASAVGSGIPAGIIPDEIREKFDRGGCMLSAVFFDRGSSSEETMEAIGQIRRTAGEKCFVSGLSAVVTDTRDLVESQEGAYVGIAVALCALVLTFTMDSFLLPLIFLLCIGVSILWNMGSNVFLGEISYVTKAVAAVLQLGVTLDYSIFLWHSYREQKALTGDRDEAMAEAIHLTFTSILGSSLTTIAGFISICFMSFTLGRDLGVVMSKGVVLGVLGTVVLLPCVIRAMDGAIEKTSHRPLLPDVGRISRFVTVHSRALAVILLIVCVPAFYGYANVNVYYDMSRVMSPDLPSVIAGGKLEDTFGMAATHLLLISSDVPQEDVCAMAEEMRDVLTGFKYIGEQIAHLEAEGHPERYIMGFEESYGYLTGTDVRDKDAVNASLVICRMTAHYKALGMTLADALRDAEKRFGAFRNALENHAFAGQEGMIKMSGMMTALRENPPMEVMGLKLARLQDYQLKTDTDYASGKVTPITLPTSNVLKFYYGDKVTAVVRPSGTEPKLKIYHAVRGDSPAEAEELLKNWQEAFGKITEKLKA